MSFFSETIEYFENTWIKTKTDVNGKKHILLSETKEGLEPENFKKDNENLNNFSHEHYIWDDDKFRLQVRTTDKNLNWTDNKGHLLRKKSEVINYDNSTTKELETFFAYADTKTDLHYLKKEILQKNILNQNDNNMANIDEFEKQKDLLIDFKNYQQAFANKFRECLQNYRKTIDSFEDGGLTKNYVDALNEDYNELDNQHIKQICDEIEDEDMKHTQNMIDDLEEIIDKIKKRG